MPTIRKSLPQHIKSKVLIVGIEPADGISADTLMGSVASGSIKFIFNFISALQLSMPQIRLMDKIVYLRSEIDVSQ